MNFKKISILTLSLIFIVGMFTMVSAKTVNLELWTFVNAHADYYQMKAKEFNKAHPEFDFKLHTQSLPYNQMHDKLNMALQTGMGAPDICDVEIGRFPGIVANSASALVDLTPVIDKYKDDLVQARLAPYSKDGKVYGIPTHIGTAVIYYNKELFDKAGVDPDSIKTWQDYIEAGKKLTKDTNGDGKIDQWMTAVPSASVWPFHLMSREFGSDAFDKDGNIVLDRDENVKALQLLQDMIYKYKIGKLITTDYHDQNFYDEMNSGKYASVLPMPQWYTIRFTEFMPDLKGKILVRPMPAWKSGGTISGTGGGTGTLITKQSKNIDVAKQFLAFAKLTKEAGVQIWTKLGFDPIVKSAYKNKALYKPLPYFNNEKVMNTIEKLQPEIQPLYLTGQYPEVQTMLGEEILFKTLQQNKDVAKTLKEAADKLRSEK